MAIITLLDWLKAPPSDVPEMRAIASLAAELGTNRGENPDSVWSNVNYGGQLAEIRAIPGATLALTAEAQRIVDRHAVGGQVSLTDAGAQIDIGITLTSEGLNLAPTS